MLGLFSTCFFVSATSNRRAGQSMPIKENGEINTSVSKQVGVHREIAYRPGFVVKVNLIDGSKRTVYRLGS